MKFYIRTLGCKQNTSESELLREALENAGNAFDPDAPELIILHSCAVTNKAEYKSRDALRRLKKRFPDARIAVIGCAAENSPEKFKSIGADKILINSEKFDLSNYIDSAINLVGINDRRLEHFKSQSRAFLSIQDGCDLSCAYCIITKLRGPSVSKSKAAIFEEINSLKAAGKNEIVLTGINTALWGKEWGGSFTELVSELSAMKGMRFRLSSLNPDLIDEQLLFLIARENSICPHLHISLQSGSAEVLKGQRRFYSPGLFIDITQKLKALDPRVRIGIDIIAGLPGEDENKFEETLTTLSKAKVDYMHIFRFSPRAGTDSAKMKYPNGLTAKRRAGILRELDSKMRAAFLGENIGVLHRVVLEERHDKKGYVIGMTENYLDVGVKTRKNSDSVWFIGETIVNGRLYGKERNDTQ